MVVGGLVVVTIVFVGTGVIVVGGLQELTAHKFDDLIEAKNYSVSKALVNHSYPHQW